jgi:type II secretory pathway pseudopilin PulG
MKRSNRGFTLVEVIVVSSLTVLLVGAVSFAIMYFYRVNAFAIEQAMAINDARKGVESLIEDIREAAYSDEGSYPLIAAGTSTFEFYSDVSGDTGVEKIRYYMDGEMLKKGVTFSTGTPPTYTAQPEVEYIVADNVRNVALGDDIFVYYDSTGAVVADTAADLIEITYVEMSVIVNINPERLPNDYTLYSSATMRNIVNAL